MRVSLKSPTAISRGLPLSGGSLVADTSWTLPEGVLDSRERVISMVCLSITLGVMGAVFATAELKAGFQMVGQSYLAEIVLGRAGRADNDHCGRSFGNRPSGLNGSLAAPDRSKKTDTPAMILVIPMRPFSKK